MNIYPNKPYDNNYGLKLSIEEQNEILQKCQHYYNKMMDAAIHNYDDETQRKTYMKYHDYLSELEDKNIYVEYGWVGHLNEHFMPSEEDAWKQEVWLDRLREEY